MKKACRDGYGGIRSELWKRLDEMGKDLNDAISQMLRGIEMSHRPALAFYLQALMSYEDSDMRIPFTVGLMVASRHGEEVRTRSQFLAACRREQLDIQTFSQGIIEVTAFQLTSPDMKSALIRSHSNRSSESDLQHETLDFEPGEGAWVTVAHADHYLETTKFFEAGVSLIHRSAYDFFFAPDKWNAEHIAQCKSLLEHNEDTDGSEVRAQVQAGLRKILWIKPWPVWHRNKDTKYTLETQIADCSSEAIKHVIANSNMSSIHSNLTEYVANLLSSMRLELLLSLIKAPIVESRKNVPGDIFARHLHDGCLRTLDEDRLLVFELTGLQKDLKIMAKFESRFLGTCGARCETLYDFIQIRLRVSNGHAIAPLVQAALLNLITLNPPKWRNWWLGRGRVLLLNSVKRWMYALVCKRRSKQFYNSVWQWIVRLVPGHDDSPRHEGPKGTRLSIARISSAVLERSSLCVQWTPLALDDITCRHEEILIKALVLHGVHVVGFPTIRQAVSVSDSLVQIMDCWDMWIEILSAKGRPHNRIALFVRMDSLFCSNPKEGSEPILDPRGARYRLTCIDESADDNDSSNLHFSVDIDPSLGFYDGPVFVARTYALVPVEAVPLKQEQVDVLIDAVRQSMKLDKDQKIFMIEGIMASEFGVPED
jgi:hypothetical protein